jgi:hypothetical protein
MGILYWLRPLAATLLALFGAVMTVLGTHEGVWLFAILGLVAFGIGVKLVRLEEEQPNGGAA